MTANIDKVVKGFLHEHAARAHNTFTDGQYVYYHGHCIFWRDSTDQVLFSFCGWPTVTTAARINRLLAAIGVETRVTIRRKEGRAFVLRDGARHEISTTAPIPVGLGPLGLLAARPSTQRLAA